ncbi:MAG: Mov34/MPN/PAD-1 family protein [Nannocystaceae bacterium]|nr:Mov34/MPN/PAD-1 family protein [Nannocystaceae bacterium]
MSEREVCFIIGRCDTVLWSDASDSPVALPDTRSRWQAIWSRRDDIVEIAHTHPLGGAHFSHQDETTMAALNTALGRSLIYSVVTPDSMLRRTQNAEDCDDTTDAIVVDEPWWTALIRVASGIESSTGKEQ